MPSTKGLEVFVRKNQLADEEWFGLIEARRELIKPHLDSFTLPELGSFECMRSEVSFTHELRLDVSTTTGDERFSLKTQGIFRIQPWSAVERIPNSGNNVKQIKITSLHSRLGNQHDVFKSRVLDRRPPP